jgi:nucleoid-associated protein YgaU
MFSRPAIIGVIGAIVVIAAVLLNFFMTEESPLEQAAVAPAAAIGATGSGTANSTGTKAAKKDKAVSSPTSDAGTSSTTQIGSAPEKTLRPIFDVVRVDPEGNTVIAGRARPNTKVSILDGDKVIGEVMSDGRGDWVFVPEARLQPGSRVLTLSTGKDGADKLESNDAVVLVIPEPGKDISGAKSTGDRTPLAMVVPRDKALRTATRVIQAPKVSGSSVVEAETALKVEPKAQKGEIIETLANKAKDKDKVVTSSSQVTAVEPKESVVRSFPEPEKSNPGGENADSKAPVALDTVDYDDKGDVVFSGKAKPGEKVQVYVDNKLVGIAAAGTDGRWTLRPTTPVKPGNHDIRVDKVAETGKVLARIELTFVRAKPFTSLPNQTVVIIQPGNNLWRIASKVYGDGLRYTEIFQANADQIRNADLIYPGQVFGLPKTN